MKYIFNYSIPGEFTLMPEYFTVEAESVQKALSILMDKFPTAMVHEIEAQKP